MNWYGHLPNGWQTRKIRELFSERNEKVSDNDYQALSVSKHGTVPQLENVAKTLNGDSRKLVRKGDYAINSRSDRKGSSGLSQHDGSISLINIVLTPRNEILGRFAHYILRSHYFIEEFYRNGRGIVSDLWTTRYSEMRTIILPLPPLEEQAQIVSWLDWQNSCIAKYIRAKKREIECLRELRKTIISKTVTKNCSDWETKRTIAMFSFSRGQSISRYDMRASGIPCIHYGDIHGHCAFEVDPSKHKLGYVSEQQISGGKDTYLKYGDFLFCGSSEDLDGSGNFAYFNSNAIAVAGTDTIRLRAMYPINHRFIAYLFDSQSFREQIRRQVNGVKVYHPTQAIIKRTVLTLPPLPIQETIVAYLDEQCTSIDTLISKHTQEINLLVEYKVRIVSDAVTGKIDLGGVDIPDFESESKIDGIADTSELEEVDGGYADG